MVSKQHQRKTKLAHGKIHTKNVQSYLATYITYSTCERFRAFDLTVLSFLSSLVREFPWVFTDNQ